MSDFHYDPPHIFLCKLPSGPDIVMRMTEPNRVYHSLSHAIDLAFMSFEYLRGPDLRFYYLASFYHDIVYRVGARDNEELSAKMFTDDVPKIDEQESMPPDLVVDVARAIRLTKNHFVADAYAQNERISKFLDMDLLVLASPKDHYDQYVAKIRMEHSHVGESDWRQGRSAFLRTALNTPKIFRTMTDTTDAAARANIERELKELN